MFHSTINVVKFAIYGRLILSRPLFFTNFTWKLNVAFPLMWRLILTINERVQIVSTALSRIKEIPPIVYLVYEL